MPSLKTFDARQYAVWLFACLLLSAPLANAAQASIDRPFTGAADIAAGMLEDSGFVVKERADTDRFAIFYVQSEAEQSVAITLFALPNQTDRMMLTVDSASPADEHFDSQLLQSIRAKLLEP